MTRKLTAADKENAIQLYLAGETGVAVAQRLGIKFSTIYKFLHRAGIPVRNNSESGRRHMATVPLKEKQRRIAIAHAGYRAAAARPGWRDVQRRHKALTLQYTRGRAGRGEDILIAWLHERGLVTMPQLAIDVYNIDIGILPVAVELSIYSTVPHRRAQERRKIVYLVQRGIHVIYVLVPSVDRLTPAAADHIVTFYELAKRDPSPVGEYRVIRGSGELMLSFSNYLDYLTLVPAPKSFRYPGRG